MARTEAHIAAPPERIFEVLSDPDSYGRWVVGSKQIRDADAGFPAPGTKFHHTVGFGPFEISDETVILDFDPPRLVKLRAKARPLGTAIVTLRVKSAGRGSTVTMIEDPADPLTAFVFNPLTHLLVRGRNAKSLERLSELAEGDEETPREDRDSPPDPG